MRIFNGEIDCTTQCKSVAKKYLCCSMDKLFDNIYSWSEVEPIGCYIDFNPFSFTILFVIIMMLGSFPISFVGIVLMICLSNRLRKWKEEREYIDKYGSLDGFQFVPMVNVCNFDCSSN